jgi:hypothetical protein
MSMMMTALCAKTFCHLAFELLLRSKALDGGKGKKDRFVARPALEIFPQLDSVYSDYRALLPCRCPVAKMPKSFVWYRRWKCEV